MSHGTVRNMEATGQASMASFIRIVQSLGLLGELEPLEPLFVAQIKTIADMEKAQAAPRQRVPRKLRP